MSHTSRGIVLALVAACACAGWSACAAEKRKPLQPPIGDPHETCLEPARCGFDGPLISMPVPAVHSGLVWSTDDWDEPQLLFWTRHSNVRGGDVAARECLEQLILGSYSSWPIPSAEWMLSFPDDEVDRSNPFKDSDPGDVPPGYTFNQCLRSSFKQLMAGGYRLRTGLTQSVPQRIETYFDRELTQVWNINRPDAFNHGGVFYTELLDEKDAIRNLGSFDDAGYSRNLKYDLYCAGHSTLADGRVIAVGGHNMNSNNGYRKVNIYDPEVERWEPRPESCLRENWQQDRYGRALGYRGIWEELINPPPAAPMWPDCSPRVRESTDPPAPSDMRYARWYPTSIIMPNGMVLILSGTDQDESVGPDISIEDKDQRDAAFRATQIYQAVPEVFDPATGTTVALENARRRFPLYPQATVVQTGPDTDDWQVCALGGLPAPAEEATPTRNADTNPAAEWRLYCAEPGCENDERAIRFSGPYPAASLDCLDVQAALADPLRNVPAESHWTHMTTASDSHDYCCPMADMVEIDSNGATRRHEWIVFGGKQPAGELAPGAESSEVTDIVAGIDFAEDSPQWTTRAFLYQPNDGADAIVLPDGNVLIAGGEVGVHLDEEDEVHVPLDERWNLKYQIFEPATGGMRTVSRTTVPRGSHGTAVLLPDATVMIMGYNRHSLVQEGSDVFPPGDADLGVSNGSIYYPPYLFNAYGFSAPRPDIVTGLDTISYGDAFNINVGAGQRIDSVVLIRTDFVTHTLNTGARYVKLAHTQAGKSLSIDAPRLASQAPPGDYMLFVVDDQGVPSHAKHVRLGVSEIAP
jgi:hypothetical protein